MKEDNSLKQKIVSFPHHPGVYLMKDKTGRIIYVGKAKDLKNRVASYFTGKDARPMAPFLMARVQDIEFINTATVKEALILENNLIKRHRPRYNVTLRDDKTYYHLSLDLSEKFPRLQLVRKRLKDKALYFGPYPSGLAAKETLRFVQQIFPLRSCRNRDFKIRPRPCLEHQIGRCLAPCKGLISEQDYRKLVDGVVSFLQGRRRELISDLKKQMHEASDNLHYEEAARLRDRFMALEHALEKQSVDGSGGQDQDVFGLYQHDREGQLCVLFVRGGQLLGSKSFASVKVETDMSEILSSCLTQYYDNDTVVPDEIIIPCRLPDEAVIAEWLAEKKNRKVMLTVPSIGTKKSLLDMAYENARSIWEAAQKKEKRTADALRMLQEKLSLTRFPRRLECYDISNISGQYAVGSMVVFQDGEPDKNSYRRYRIRSLPDPDDYAMMRELLSRRFDSRENPPDLIVVDGGKGQLNVALSVLRDLHLRVDAIGLAKEERAAFPAKSGGRKKSGKSEDRVYLPRRKDAVYLSAWPQALRILQQARDEAHRFALRYHQTVRQKKDLRSILDDIPDIGKERRKILLKYFGSDRRLRESSMEELQKVPGIGKLLAEKIYAHL
ncbi:MAG: excinuclease ABC subunit UvrC, partial [Smithella sp.]|nr:excinuclease ABC subunit UvrC [Smithella sp.]